jgi:membrane protein
MKAIVGRAIERVDEFQQRDARLGFVVAVVKKFGNDQAGYLAALIAYYAFFSLFPLLLVGVTVLSMVLGRTSKLRANVVNSMLGKLPIIGPQVRGQAIHGSGIGLAIGIVITLLAGFGVIQAVEHAMDEVWHVPRQKRPNFLWSRLRAMIMLGILGVATLGATVISGLAGVLGPIGSAVVNIGVILVAFKVLTAADVSFADVLPGAVLAGVALTVLQWAGSYYIGHVLRNASETYGTFAVVIGLLSWLYLGAEITLYCAEINVVRARHLWPVSLKGPAPAAGADAAAAPAPAPAPVGPPPPPPARRPQLQ